jgi:hypothetical protein
MKTIKVIGKVLVFIVGLPIVVCIEIIKLMIMLVMFIALVVVMRKKGLEWHFDPKTLTVTIPSWGGMKIEPKQK